MGGDQIFEQVEKIVIDIMTKSKIPGISLAILSLDKFLINAIFVPYKN